MASPLDTSTSILNEATQTLKKWSQDPTSTLAVTQDPDCKGMSIKTEQGILHITPEGTDGTMHLDAQNRDGQSVGAINVTPDGNGNFGITSGGGIGVDNNAGMAFAGAWADYKKTPQAPSANGRCRLKGEKLPNMLGGNTQTNAAGFGQMLNSIKTPGTALKI